MGRERKREPDGGPCDLFVHIWDGLQHFPFPRELTRLFFVFVRGRLERRVDISARPAIENDKDRLVSMDF